VQVPRLAQQQRVRVCVCPCGRHSRPLRKSGCFCCIFKAAVFDLWSCMGTQRCCFFKAAFVLWSCMGTSTEVHLLAPAVLYKKNVAAFIIAVAL
jgi:hypothetical protein